MPNLLYSPGDVVLLPFPYEEDPSKFKYRPALIIDINDGIKLATLKITGTNKISQKKGMWVEKDSKRGMLMGLTKDSFIDCSRIVKVDEFEITQMIGYMDDDGFEQIEYIVSK